MLFDRVQPAVQVRAAGDKVGIGEQLTGIVYLRPPSPEIMQKLDV
jgi:hypothetical protein